MCGILGFIGRSQNPKVSFELANALLIKTESRGEHATGFWSCERGNGRIFYDKEPVKSSIYTNRDIWAVQYADVNADLLIAHCRLSSAGVGHEKFNKNNHPHVSADRRVALIHNGKIPEYNALRGRYDLRSDCDSEILLTMFESGEEFKSKEDYLHQEFPKLSSDVAYRMMGMKEIFSRVNYGAMAVAIAERFENERGRRLWLFRDEERPIHVVDMRSTLGQIWFCSTPEIWKTAVDMTPSVKPYIPDDKKVIEFPPHQVWMLQTEPSDEDATNPDADVWKTKKFRIIKTKFYDYKSDDDDKKVFRPKSQVFDKLVSRLQKDEEVVEKTVVDRVDHIANSGNVPSLARKKKATYGPIAPTASHSELGTELISDDDDARSSASGKDEALSELTEITLDSKGIDMKAFETAVEDVSNLLAEIRTKIRELKEKDNLTDKEFDVVMTSMKDAKSELTASLMFIKP